jgi:hypothetical protein
MENKIFYQFVKIDKMKVYMVMVFLVLNDNLFIIDTYHKMLNFILSFLYSFLHILNH